MKPTNNPLRLRNKKANLEALVPGSGTHWLNPEHWAAGFGRSVFQKSVVDPEAGADLLRSGFYNRKIGSTATKSRWRGMPIYVLALEERATCPSDCRLWLGCYGNRTPFQKRWRHGENLVELLEANLAALQYAHPHGFVVRLHVLGDFYSVDYVQAWAKWLDRFPALHVYGYSARSPETPIGAAVHGLASTNWDRFAVRHSASVSAERTAVTVDTPDQAPEGAVVCPAQTGQTQCCATCGLCWQTTKAIAFVMH